MHELIIIATGLKMISLIVAVLSSLIVLTAKKKSKSEETLEKAKKEEEGGSYYSALMKYEGIGFYENAAKCAYKGWEETRNPVYLNKMEKYVRSAQSMYNNTGKESDYKIMQDIRSKYREMKEEYETSPGSYLPPIEETGKETGGWREKISGFFGRRKKTPVLKPRKTVLRPKRKGKQ